MASPVQDLLSHKPDPLCISPAESAAGACRIMRENGFSQLPVISDKKVALGLVTHESILRALGYFNVSLDRLRVSAALTHPRMFYLDDDLFDLLDALTTDFATLIVDKAKHVLGIVTQDDLLIYFRRRAEDLILVEEIELGLREHVLCAFSDKAGVLAREELCAAIDEVADQVGRMRKKFRKALTTYVSTTSPGKGGAVDEAEAERAFKAFDLKYRAKELTELSFEETRALLLHEQRWSSYGATFGIEKKALSDLLERVRDARNKLAHFRGDLSDDERERLRFCAQFLDNHRPAAQVPTLSSIREAPGQPLEQPAAAPPARPALPGKSGDGATGAELYGISTVEDEPDFEESRYAPLIAYLTDLSQEIVSLSFEDVEVILGRKLPASATRHRAWWANDRVSHVQSRLWLEAGWRVSSVSVTDGTVTFTKIKGREDAYIAFFSRLLHEAGRSGSPSGTNWQVIERLGSGEFSSTVLCTFARGSRLRIELYIDLSIKDEERRRAANKRLFDALAGQRDEIEGVLGQPLEWERLEHRLASRIALYTEGSILDEADQLGRLVKWAAQQLVPFLEAIAPRVQGVLAQIASEE